MIKNISNLGDAAVYCDFGSEVNREINSNVIRYFTQIKQLVDKNSIQGILNLTPSYNKLVISFDLSLTNFSKIKKIIQELEIEKKDNIISNLIKIPICTINGFSFDFERISKITSKTKKEIGEK